MVSIYISKLKGNYNKKRSTKQKAYMNFINHNNYNATNEA
jgi:hypothetical protein